MRDHDFDEGAAGAVGGLFGLATLLLGAGQQSTLITAGLYNEPQGAWLPSIVY